MSGHYFCTVPEAVHEARRGKMLVLVDSPKRENEADLYIPADAATPRVVTTMIKEGGGILCVALTTSQARRLGLSLMVPLRANAERTRVNFTISANARRGITTGVSAHDRAKTIQIFGNPRSQATDLVKPGHVLGLVARKGGLLEREGHTEAAVELARLAGRAPAGALCEVVGLDGRMARRGEILRLSRKLRVKVMFVSDLVRYLRKEGGHESNPKKRI